MMTDVNESLTERQQEVLAFLADEVRHTGSAPSVREIARHFHMASPRAASDHLDALERKGYLARAPGRARNIRLTHDPSAIPIVGTVAAGAPILAEEHRVGEVDLPNLFGSGDLFAVRVQGDSMRDAGILEGDLVVVQKDGRIEQDGIGVAYLDGEATVKRIHRRTEGFNLVPENPAYRPIEITPETPGFALAGPVVGVVRRLR